MATFKYFTTCNTQQVELSGVFMADAMFNVIRGAWQDLSQKPYRFQGRCPSCGQQHLVQRAIEWKKEPSLHVCSGKCVNGKANGACECSCGGKNHGVGSIFRDNGFRAAA